jgi:lipoprotein-anchoring transpeptidase ErfK/SrfK
VTLLVLVTLLAIQTNRNIAPAPGASGTCADPLSYQVRLDRAGFSPGEIDATLGPNLQRAIGAFQKNVNLPATGRPDCATWEALGGAGGAEVLTGYTVTPADVNGDYLGEPLPADLAQQARFSALSYASVAESIAERFHASPRLIARLNRGVRLEAGVTLTVPAVTPFDPSSKPTMDTTAGNVSIEVSRHDSTLRAVRADGTLAFFAPVSSGSDHDPLPIGTWKVTGTAWMPPFHYNPDLFWDAEPGDSKATLQPGPNNPIGVVWIDINVPHYGMHGTPTPNLVGHAQSHGCVRLTNWDAARLASLVRPGTRVVFSE